MALAHNLSHMGIHQEIYYFDFLYRSCYVHRLLEILKYISPYLGAMAHPSLLPRPLSCFNVFLHFSVCNTERWEWLGDEAMLTPGYYDE